MTMASTSDATVTAAVEEGVSRLRIAFLTLPQIIRVSRTLMLGRLYIRLSSPVGCRLMNARARRLLVVPALAALALVVTLAGCTQDDGTRITVYSGRQADLIQPLLEQFSDFKPGDSGELALLIEQEGDASPADVFLSQSPGAMGFLDAAGRLRPLPEDVLDLVPEAYRAPDGDFVGVSGRVRTLVYNTEALAEDELPASVLDLTDPAWEGRVGVAPENASFQDFVTALRSEIGDDATQAWLDGLAANARTYANNQAIVEAVGRGEIEVGLVNHYYNVRALQNDPDVPSQNHFFPTDDPGSLLILSTAGVVNTSEHVPEAERLVAFLLSEQAQRYFADETFEYPLAPGVAPAEGVVPLEEIAPAQVDTALYGAGFEQTLAMIDQAGFDQ
jgi:iron(III) transport system substrate-binding protein